MSKHLRRAKLGSCLDALGNCVLGKFPGQDQPNCRLDVARTESAFLVVLYELAGLSRDLVENIDHERFHDAHALRRNTCIGMHLLEHLVDVGGESLIAALLQRLATWQLGLPLHLCFSFLPKLVLRFFELSFHPGG